MPLQFRLEIQALLRERRSPAESFGKTASRPGICKFNSCTEIGAILEFAGQKRIIPFSAGQEFSA